MALITREQDKIDNRDGSEDLVLQIQPKVIQTIQSTSPRFLTLTPLPRRLGGSSSAKISEFVTVRSPGAARTETANTASSSLDDSTLLAKLNQAHAKIAALEDQLSSSSHSRASGSSGSGDTGDRHPGSPHGSASRRSDDPGARAPTRRHRSDRHRREEQTQRDRRAERYTERLEAQRREDCLEAQRRADCLEERRREERREELLAAREQQREDRREADRREDRRAFEALFHQMQAHQAHPGRSPAEALSEAEASSPPSVQPRYTPGVALQSVRMFDGGPGADSASYLVEMADQLGLHRIPHTEWSRELRLKLKDKAVLWYKTQYKTQAAGTFPPWGDLSAEMLLAFSPQYQAARAYRDLESAVRPPNSTGAAALQHIDALTLLLERRGVSNPGPNERQSYRYQNLLTPAEHDRWTSLANADPQISEKRLNELELRTPAAPTSGRRSCSGETRELFFLGRVDHLRSFLREQGATRAPGGTARAAVSQATSVDNTGMDPTTPAAGPQPSPASGVTPSDTWYVDECRCIANRGDRLEQAQGKWQKNGTPLPPPEYHGTNANARHAAANLVEFNKRKESGACFHCPMTGTWKVDYDLFHTLCPTHGRSASVKDRTDAKKGVVGAGRIY